MASPGGAALVLLVVVLLQASLPEAGTGGFCSYKEFSCPSKCKHSCSMNCQTCEPICDCDKPGGMCQDPRIVGGDGVTFYFHGKKDHDFCLVTDSNLHINGHFIGKSNEKTKKDFTWVQSLGILFDDHKLYVGVLKTATWHDRIDRLTLSFDDEPIDIPKYKGAVWNSASGALTITRRHDTNVVEMEAKGNFKIEVVALPISGMDNHLHGYGITADDCFAHLDLSFKFFSLTSAVNGVLGQTYSPTYVSKVNVTDSMPTLGGDEAFATSELFATDCSVARFTGVGGGHDESDSAGGVVGDIRCGRHDDHHGVVCRR